MVMKSAFDAIIIGAGQAGPPLANRLTASGMKVAVVERGRFGGTCVNTGCMPTKTMVASAYAARLAQRGAEYGVVHDHPSRIDMSVVRRRAAKVTADASNGVRSWLEGMSGCTIVEGHARFEAPNVVRVEEDTLCAPRIFINVGGRPIIPDLPGLGNTPFLTNSSLLRLEAVPRHLLIIGGSYIGLEFGQMFRRFGAEVTIIEKGERLVGREDVDVSEAIRDILTAEGIRVHTSAECIRLANSDAGIAVTLSPGGDQIETVGIAPAAGIGPPAQHGRSRPRGGRRGQPTHADLSWWTITCSRTSSASGLSATAMARGRSRTPPTTISRSSRPIYSTETIAASAIVSSVTRSSSIRHLDGSA